jgi:hypothetical protein
MKSAFNRWSHFHDSLLLVGVIFCTRITSKFTHWISLMLSCFYVYILVSCSLTSHFEVRHPSCVSTKYQTIRYMHISSNTTVYELLVGVIFCTRITSKFTHWISLMLSYFYVYILVSCSLTSHFEVRHPHCVSTKSNYKIHAYIVKHNCI